MAWLAHALQQAGQNIDWGEVVVNGFTHAWSAAQSSWAHLSTLPRDCRIAATHAVVTCGGYAPDYQNIPGFCPIPLGWGWLTVGILIGVGMGCLGMLAMQTRSRGRPHLHTTGFDNPAGLGAQTNVLAYLQCGGRPALQELALAANMSETEFLYRAVGTQYARPPGLHR